MAKTFRHKIDYNFCVLTESPQSININNTHFFVNLVTNWLSSSGLSGQTVGEGPLSTNVSSFSLHKLTLGLANVTHASLTCGQQRLSFSRESFPVSAWLLLLSRFSRGRLCATPQLIIRNISDQIKTLIVSILELNVGCISFENSDFVKNTFKFQVKKK